MTVRQCLAGVLIAALVTSVLVLSADQLLSRADQDALVRAAAWFTLHLCVVYAVLAWRRPHDRVLPCFAVSALAWSVYVAIEQHGSSSVLAIASAAICRHVWAGAGFLLVVRLAEIPCRWFERTVLSYVGAVVFVLVVAAAFDSHRWAALTVDFSAIIVRTTGLIVALAAARTLIHNVNWELAVLLLSGLVIMFLSAEPLWSRVAPDVDARALGTLCFGPTLTILLIQRLSSALRTAENVSANLELAVADKTHELEQQFEQVRTLEREHARRDERERIMRDMHDGVGGQLIALLANVRRNASVDRDLLLRHLRAALLDLRHMIDSLDNAEGNLQVALAMFRSRVQPLIDASGWRSEWRLDDMPDTTGYSPRALLDITRILQEAVSNALAHSGGQFLRVNVTDRQDDVCFEIRDDGVAATDVEAGRGMTNMRVRAARIDARLDWQTDELGTAVVLCVPVVRRTSGSVEHQSSLRDQVEPSGRKAVADSPAAQPAAAGDRNRPSLPAARG